MRHFNAKEGFDCLAVTAVDFLVVVGFSVSRGGRAGARGPGRPRVGCQSTHDVTERFEAECRTLQDHERAGGRRGRRAVITLRTAERGAQGTSPLNLFRRLQTAARGQPS